MTSHLDTGSVHPIASLVRSARLGLDDPVDVPTWSLDADLTRESLTELSRLASQLVELETRIIGRAETLDLPTVTGARPTAVWLARHTTVTLAEARRKTCLADALTDHSPTRDALARGDVHAEQARVIAAAVDDLDRRHDRERAEQHLLVEAAHHDARALTALGRRILETLDPARADEREAGLLERQEARAAEATRLTLTDDGQGCTRGRFTISTAQASMLRKMLAAHAAPKHVRAVEGAGTYHHERPTPARLGRALCELIERYPASHLPHLGGINATVVITADHQTLLGQAKAAHLDTGDAISPGQLRRLAREAGILPAVVDGAGLVLDLGRRRRFHSRPQRLAIALEQQTCQHPTCQTAAAYCHVHHGNPRSAGGPTDTRHAVLLCPFQHHRAHGKSVLHPMRTYAVHRGRDEPHDSSAELPHGPTRRWRVVRDVSPGSPAPRAFHRVCARIARSQVVGTTSTWVGCTPTLSRVGEVAPANIRKKGRQPARDRRHQRRHDLRRPNPSGSAPNGTGPAGPTTPRPDSLPTTQFRRL